MTTFLIVLHVMACIVLIAVVLLQRGKGSDIGAALGGGGSNTVFGSRGAGNFLTKLTTACAVTFMLTSLTLSYIASHDTSLLIMDDEEATPASEAAPSTDLEETETEADAPSPSGALEEIPLPTAEDEPAP
jgi:preprotein translocase subunit SecG